MCHNNRRIGAAAVEFVVSRFETGRFGIPGLPETLLVTSRWLANGTGRLRHLEPSPGNDAG
jgi:hypothetical protein